MSTNFPSGLDSSIASGTGTTGQPLSNPNHITQHLNEDAAILALETKVGIDSSADTTSIDYKLKSTSSVNPGHKHTLTSTGFTDVNLTSVTDGDVLTYNGGSSKWVNSSTSAPDASTTVKGVTKMSVSPISASSPIAVGDNDGRVPTQNENDALVGTSGSPSSSNKFVTNDDTSATSSASKVVRANSSGKIDASYLKFGGTGADGVLSISSGTTTVNLGGVALFILNYTSVSITGTGNLAFSNPNANGTVVIIKSQGNVTITTSSTHAIDLRLIGGAGGAQGSNGNGTAGSASSFYLDSATHFGGGGGSSSLGGVAITTSRNFYPISASNFINTHFKIVVPGSGGGGGAGGSSGGLGGTGGFGAGGLYMEVGGAYNFTTGAIDASGQTGTNGNSVGNGGAGAGGGAGGMIVVVYNTLTAESGTYNTAGGNGGNAGAGAGESGGGGGACLVAGGNGGNGGGASNPGLSGSSDTGTGGSGGTGSGTSQPAGGGGGAGGFKISILNTEFA